MRKKTVLGNNLTIVTDTISHVETVSLGAWFNVGARFETQAQNGLSHVLEHMAFKGTKSRTALKISETIESVGGYLNAYTSRESTAYYARVLKEHAPLAVDILGDILQNSTFAEAELKREKQVILQEIGQTQDTPDDIVFDYFQDTCYPDQPVGRSILGPVENVKGFTSEQVQSYMQNHYFTKNMVFAAAGNIDHDALVDLVQKHFEVFPEGERPKCLEASYQGGDFRVQKDLEQVHVVAGFKGVKLGDDLYFPQMLATTLLGGGMSSRLFQEVREKRGLVYTISAFATSATDSGIFGVYAGTGPEQVKELLPVVAEELNKAKTSLKEEELNRAKAQLKASLMMGLESTSQRCERLANNILFHGRIIDISETIKKIEAVTLSDIYGYLSLVLKTTPTLTTLGPIANVMDYETYKSLYN